MPFFAGFARSAIRSDRVKDYTTRPIRTVCGTVEVRNPRMLCRECRPGMVGAFRRRRKFVPIERHRS